MPLVLVDISPAESPPALARTLVDACSSALRAGECDLTRTSPPDIVAIVRWDDADELRVTVQVGQGGDEPAWQTRELDFHASDARSERWRSVGLTVATLAGGIATETATPDAPSPEPSPGPQRAQVPTAPRPKNAETRGPRPRQTEAAKASHAAATRAGWIDVALRAGPGLRPGGARFGVQAVLDWRPGASPLFVGVDLGVAARPRDPRGLFAHWETAALRVGAVLGHGALSFEPRLGAGWTQLHVQVTDAGSGRRDSGGQSVATLNAGIGVTYRLGPVGLLLDASGWRGKNPTQIVLKNRLVSTDDALGWSAGIGVRWFIW